jgi:L-ectoine synthase
MIVRTLESIEGTDRTVSAETWTSRRLLLRHEGMGFSMHDTLIHAGTETRMWYRNHLEAVYCIEGEGELESLADGALHPVRPGTLYALDRHDKHILRARSRMRMICVFNPPLSGKETHGTDGSYPLNPEEA